MLTRNTDRVVKSHPRALQSIPAAAGQLVFNGSIICTNAAGLAVRGIVGAVRVAGVAVEPIFPEDPKANVHLDNTNGSAGAWSGDRIDRGVRIDTVGEYCFANVAGAPLPGGKAYLVDDDALSSLPSSSALVLGEFTQPHGAAGWFVDISKRNQPVQAAVTMAAQAAAGGAQEVALQLVDEHGVDLPMGVEVSWYLAEDAAGLIRTTTAADGGVAAGADGSLSETVAGVAGMATTGPDGALSIVVSHSLNRSFWLVATVLGSGRKTVSTELIPTP